MTTPTIPTDNTGKMMTRRPFPGGRSSVLLTYPAAQASRLRALAQSIRIKGDHAPSLSLLARRSLELYLAQIEHARAVRPDLFALEIAQLESMVTPTPQPAPKSKRAALSELIGVPPGAGAGRAE